MKYRHEIDGLRAVAVLPVILFHAGISVFSGGYVGVDVFFVISGYLITSILIAELERGDFSIARFYERRARRILPALTVVILACIPFAYAWMLPSQLKDFGESIVAVVFFASNVLFWRESGYFDASAELKPLLHTWSLAVEEQYYVLFPLFLMVFWRFGRRQVLGAICILAVLSMLLSEWALRNHPSGNFYLSPTRAWELFAGSICAFMMVGKVQRSNNLLSAAGLAAIVFAIFAYDQETPFPSLYALVPVLGACLIILFAGSETWVAKLLSMRAFVGIGLISYSAYLWHQPLFAFARVRSMTEPSHLLMTALAVAALLLAWVTWHFVEQPFRKRPEPLLRSQRSVFAVSGVVGAVFVAVGLTGHLTNGFENREYDGLKLAELEQRAIVNYGLHSDCEGDFNSSENCFTSTTPDVLLWGDSYAMHLVQGRVASEDGIAIQQHTRSVCAPVLGIARVSARYTEKWATECIGFSDQVLNWLHENDSVEVVVLSSPFYQLLEETALLEGVGVVSDPSVELVADQIRRTAQEIRAAGARVVIVSPPPFSGWNNGQCLLKTVFFGANEASCDFELDEGNEVLELLTLVSDTVPVYVLHDDFCPSGQCDVMQDGVLIYRDEGHLSHEGSAYLGRKHNWMENLRAMAN